MELLQRWRSLMSRLGASERRETFDKLCAAYSEPHRHYHTLEHVGACLGQLDGAEVIAESVDEVELALWFHDVIYAVRRNDNERRSAETALTVLESIGVGEGTKMRVESHIMATEHNAPFEAADSTLVVDIDLSIPGSSVEEYKRFEENIRREYSWVPSPMFRSKRREILERFLSRSSIYGTEHFRDRLEATARKNLQAAIDAL